MRRVLLFTLILVVISANAVAAAVEEKVGPLPGQRFYFFRSFLESVKLMLARNPDSRAELLALQAETRAREITQLVQQQASDELVLKTIERQEKLLAELNQLVENGKLSDDAYNKVLASQARVLDALTNNLSQVSARAQEVIAENVLKRGQKLLDHLKHKQEKVKEAVSEIVDDALVKAVEEAGQKAGQKVQAAHKQMLEDLESHYGQLKGAVGTRVQTNVVDIQNRLKQVKDKLPRVK